MDLTSRSRGAGILALMSLVLVTAGCGGAASTPVPEVCTDLAAFQEALDELTQVDVIATGTDGVKAAVKDVVSDGLALVGSAKEDFGPSAQAFATALTGLQTALAGLTGDTSLGDKAASVENSIDDVATAFDDLKAELSVDCPAS
jgi:hypothetical protein